MKKLISFERAIQLSQTLFGLFILFHLAIIFGILFFDFVPLDFVWGGRMQTREQLLSFEVISLLIMSLCFLIVLIRSGKIKLPKMAGVIRIALWVLFLLFSLNTIGNILAKTTFEKFFAVITLVLALLCLRLALEKNNDENSRRPLG